MIDHKGETIDVVGTDMQGRDWYSTSTGEGQYFVTDPNGIACGVYNPDGSVFNGDCNLASFTTVDMSGRWSMNPDTDFTLSINNLLGKQAPFDPYTYGGLNYNPTFHQAGAVGRFITLGVKYRF
jgi:iron complex outermembrane receptor protein